MKYLMIALWCVCMSACGSEGVVQSFAQSVEATPTPAPMMPLELGTWADVQACEGPHRIIARWSNCDGTVRKFWPND